MKQAQAQPGLRSEARTSTSRKSIAVLRDEFRKFAQWAANAVGSPVAFFVSCILLVVWAATGPTFQFSDTWQLIINTGTTIVTFLMVFLIQNTQNRDAKAIHLKLDELIRSVKGARNGLVSLENLSDEELAELGEEFAKLRHRSLRSKVKERAAPPNDSELDLASGA